MAADSVASPEGTNPSPPPETSARRPAPWRGRRRTEAGEAKDEWIGLRVTKADHARIDEKAQAAGYKIGGYLRALALGSAGARLVNVPVSNVNSLRVFLGKSENSGSNVNQLAKWSNTERSAASLAELAQIRADIARDARGCDEGARPW